MIYLILIFPIINKMKVIIHEGTKHFRSNKKLPSEESNIIKYIKEHSFYHESLPIE